MNRLLTILLIITTAGLFLAGCATDHNLAGTSWRLIQYQGQTLIPETTITLEFDQDQISGSGGCNLYFGSYRASGDGRLEINELGWTEMACLNPPGVMEQELEILTLLGEAVSYQRSGETLLIDTASGIKLEFSSQDAG